MAILGYLFLLAAAVGAIFVIVDAFKNTVWKGLLAFFCGLYWLYYAFAEFQHEKKWPIVIGTLVLGVIGYGLIGAGAMAAMGSAR